MNSFVDKDHFHQEIPFTCLDKKDKPNKTEFVFYSLEKITLCVI